MQERVEFQPTDEQRRFSTMIRPAMHGYSPGQERERARHSSNSLRASEVTEARDDCEC